MWQIYGRYVINKCLCCKMIIKNKKSKVNFGGLILLI